MATNWTPAQSEAIEREPCRILVSAAAGSGKTAVLVERICRRITDPEIAADIDRFLVVTFTNAAASGVRDKIVAAIYGKLAEQPGSRHLARQLTLLPGAQIDTISAFCLRLVRQQFHKLGISPDFRLLDETEHELLRQETLEELLDRWHEGEQAEEFRAMSDFFCAGRDDRELVELVLSLDTFLEALPNPEGFLRKQRETYRAGSGCDPLETPYGKELFTRARALTAYACGRVEKAISLCEPEERLCEKTLPVLEGDLAQLRELAEAVERGGYDGIREAAQAIRPARFSSPRGFEDRALIESVKRCREEAKSAVSELLGLFLSTAEEVRRDFAVLSRPLETLCDFLCDFRRELFERKRTRGALYFSDVEHLALSLLVEGEEDGKLLCTPFARELSARFDEIYIDEYQDINELQDRIFRAISRGEENLFMVGDVKQSIYRFRQSEPQIFIDKRDSSDGERRVRIDLSHNFRSRAPVLEFTNYLFSLLMSREGLGELDYDEGEKLRPGASFEGESRPCEVNLLKNYRGENENGPSRAEREARFAAARILNLVEGRRTVTDRETGEQRPIRYGDIVILLRSMSRVAPVFERTLREAGIPVYSEGDSSFFEREEVLSLLSLLHAVDDPSDDVQLIGAMRSELFGFSSEDLAKLRVEHPEGSFLEAVQAGDERAQNFLRRLERYRLLSENLDLPALLLHILRDLGLPDVTSAAPDGTLRRKNLRLLFEYACAYRKNGMPGLYGFLSFVDRMRESGRGLSAAGEHAQGTDAVQIMTIHKSKGLEFPVVLLCDCSHRFNMSDSFGKFLAHKELGFGFRLRDAARHADYNTVPRAAVAERMRREGLSEELRNFYVALTRAREHLILVGTVDIGRGGMLGLAETPLVNGRLQPEQLLRVKSYTGYLLAALQHHPCGGELRAELGGAVEMLPGPEINLYLHEPEQYRVKHRPQEERRARAPVQFDPAEVERRLTFRYPYAGESGLPDKLSVGEAAALLVGKSHPHIERPDFAAVKRGATGAERGTALHRFMQFADILSLRGMDAIEREIERLTEEEYLTERAADLIDRRRAVDFLDSPLCARIRAAERVLRERRFDLLFSKEDFAAAGFGDCFAGMDAKDSILLQGVIDCAFLERGRFTVLDFKTDAKDPEALAERYRPQLRLYARAVELMTGIPCGECLLYSFHRGREIVVE